jgi:multicomponent Na+:H+ antiporter subunit E
VRFAASLFVVLALLWLGWSGHFTPLLLGLGAASSLAVVLFSLRMRIVDREGAPLELAIRIPLYAPWLLWQVFKANLDVSRRILTPRMPIQPRVIRVKAGQSTDLGRVIYANSITLTPGTVSLRLEGDEIVVHALSRQAADELLGGAMDRRVTRTEGHR